MKTNRSAASQPSAALSTLALSTALLLAACGGGGAAATNPGGPVGTTGVGEPSTQAPAGGTQPPAGGEAVDVCALLSDADIEEITGHEVGATTPGAQVGMMQAGCAWQLIDDDIVPPEIVLGVVSPGGKDHYTRYFEPFNEAAGYETIPNLGDIAVDADFGSVMVVTGDAFFNLQVVGAGGDTTLVTELARRVVANLSK